MTARSAATGSTAYQTPSSSSYGSTSAVAVCGGMWRLLVLQSNRVDEVQAVDVVVSEVDGPHGTGEPDMDDAGGQRLERGGQPVRAQGEPQAVAVESRVQVAAGVVAVG